MGVMNQPCSHRRVLPHVYLDSSLSLSPLQGQETLRCQETILAATSASSLVYTSAQPGSSSLAGKWSSQHRQPQHPPTYLHPSSLPPSLHHHPKWWKQPGKLVGHISPRCSKFNSASPRANLILQVRPLPAGKRVMNWSWAVMI